MIESEQQIDDAVNVFERAVMDATMTVTTTANGYSDDDVSNDSDDGEEEEEQRNS